MPSRNADGPEAPGSEPLLSLDFHPAGSFCRDLLASGFQHADAFVYDIAHPARAAGFPEKVPLLAGDARDNAGGGSSPSACGLLWLRLPAPAVRRPPYSEADRTAGSKWLLGLGGAPSVVSFALRRLGSVERRRSDGSLVGQFSWRCLCSTHKNFPFFRTLVARCLTDSSNEACSASN